MSHKVVALVSGGKDSCFNMMECVVHGHEIVAIANLTPPDVKQDEIDSYMYQTIGHNTIKTLAEECMDVPLFQRGINGSAVSQGLEYNTTNDDEVEDLFLLLQDVKTKMPHVTAVASGAILSNYQRIRIEHVCTRLGLTSLSYLWQRDQSELLQEMVVSNVGAILVKTAGMGLKPNDHLGKSITELHDYLQSLGREQGCNVCGEGGEYESLTLDCPLFKKRIVLDTTEIVGDTKGEIAAVAVLRVNSFHTEDKSDYITRLEAWKKAYKEREREYNEAFVKGCEESRSLSLSSSSASSSSSSSSLPLVWDEQTKEKVREIMEKGDNRDDVFSRDGHFLSGSEKAGVVSIYAGVTGSGNDDQTTAGDAKKIMQNVQGRFLSLSLSLSLFVCFLSLSLLSLSLYYLSPSLSLSIIPLSLSPFHFIFRSLLFFFSFMCSQLPSNSFSRSEFVCCVSLSHLTSLSLAFSLSPFQSTSNLSTWTGRMCFMLASTSPA